VDHLLQLVAAICFFARIGFSSMKLVCLTNVARAEEEGTLAWQGRSPAGANRFPGNNPRYSWGGRSGRQNLTLGLVDAMPKAMVAQNDAHFHRAGKKLLDAAEAFGGVRPA